MGTSVSFPGVLMDSLNIMFNLPHGKLLEAAFIFCCCVLNSATCPAAWKEVHTALQHPSVPQHGLLVLCPGLTGICLYLEPQLQGSFCPARSACWPNLFS